MPTIFPAAAIVLASLALLAGCGSDSNGGDTDSEPVAASQATPSDSPGGDASGGDTNGSGESAPGEDPAGGGDGSDAGFIAEANQICVDQRAQLQQELQPYFAEAESLDSAAELEILDEVLVPAFEAEIEGLQALEPPAQHAEKLDSVIFAIEGLVAEATESPAAFAAKEEPYAETAKYVADRGFTSCARP